MFRITSTSTACVAAFTLTLAASAQITVYSHYGANASDQQGWSVAGLGDVNGDGVEDYAAGAPFAGLVSSFRPGIVRLYSGRTGEVLRTWYGAAHGDEFGVSVAPVHDFDHDGRTDLIVGSPGWNGDRGRAVIYSTNSGAQLWQVNGLAAGDAMGTAVARIGYCNGDFAQDFAVGAPNEDGGGQSNRGTVRLYSGATGGILRTITPGNYTEVYFGRALSGGVDWDDDGYHDVVVGSPLVSLQGRTWCGMASVHSSATGLTLALWYGPTAGEQYGHSVAGLGDVNGDGHDEVLIGAPLADTAGANSGRIELRSTPQGAPLRTHTGTTGEKMGYAVAAVSDADYDNRPDYAVGSPEFAFSGTLDRGIVRVFSGASGGAFGSATGQLGSSFGRSIASVGDVNGDGFGDLLVGATTSDVNGTNAGLARLLLWNQSVPSFYGAGNTHSGGCAGYVTWSGTPSLSIGDDFRLEGRNLLNNSVGLVFWGYAPANTPLGGGTRLVGGPLVRTMPQATGGNAAGVDCSGTLTFEFTQAYLLQMGVQPGTTLYAQFLQRDLGAAPNNVALTNAIEFEVIP
jgi:hypothetical protein